ncbi:chemotaxis protein CheW [Silvanigrella aquatica]|uniref:CheW-like domain-containing protein n=1 Tax=Silvanigrella aquatica TaxID=1915309 RepID=A0A1L4D1B9_9BACT|nr:chemotaxis protein CheW [Silvanigrella aquatica]APJ03999.1 hypothetical protein AXG55_08805 [Silvanigrella aquatica]
MIDFEKIKLKQSELLKDEEDQTNYFTLVKFNVGEKTFAVDIINVHEIIEFIEFTPYPEIISNHIGIINVRGEIIPLVQFEKDYNFKKNEKYKVIILEFTMGKLYALKSNKIQKILYKEKFLLPGQTINLNKTPAFYLDENLFEIYFKDSL